MRHKYLDFENVHRGKRSEIISRLKRYIGYIEPLIHHYSSPKGIDLGCGRGEWLELLVESGIEAFGVDSNTSMLSQAPESAKVHNGDLIQFLKLQKSSTFLCVTAFHVVEHIDINMLATLVSEAKRVLVPGGLLIIETPNSENISVGTDTFYIDPTHQKPVSKETLFYLCNKQNFKNIKIIGVNEGELNNRKGSLAKAIYGVSPDYAIIAQVDAPYDILKLNHDVLKTNHGVTLNEAVAEFDERRTMKDDHITYSLMEIEESVNRMNDQISDLLKIELSKQEKRLNNKITEVHHSTQLLSNKITEVVGDGGTIIELKNSVEKIKEPDLSSYIIPLEEKIAKLDTQFQSAFKSEKSQLTEKIEELQAEVATANNVIADKDNCIEWVDNEWHQALRERDKFNIQCQHLKSKLAEVALENNCLKQQVEDVKASRDKLYKSWSWRLSAPVRAGGNVLLSCKKLLSLSFLFLITTALRSRIVTKLCLLLLAPFPSIRAWLNKKHQSHLFVTQKNRNGVLPSFVNEDVALLYSLLIMEESKK